MLKNFLLIITFFLKFTLPASATEVYDTCVHKGLNIEMEGLQKNDKDKRLKELNDRISFVKKSSDFTSYVSKYKSSNSVGNQKKYSTLVLEAIHKWAFSSSAPGSKMNPYKTSSTLCQALCSDENGCLPFDCDSTAFVYLAILQDKFGSDNSPIVLLACNPGIALTTENATHALIRWKFTDSSYIDWETTIGKKSSSEKSASYQKKCREVKLCSNSFYSLFYNNRGLAKDEIKNYSSAIKDYDKAIELDANWALPYYHRGLAKSRLKNYSGAIKDYTVAIKFAPDYPSAYGNRGNAKLHLANYEGAVEDYNEAINLNPNDLKYYINRGLAKAYLGKDGDAIKDYTYAISLKTVGSEQDLSMAYSNRGFARANLKDTEGAINDFTMALRLDPNNSDAQEQLKLLSK